MAGKSKFTLDYMLSIGIGQCPDEYVAKVTGLTRRGIGRFRERHNIPAFVGYFQTQEGRAVRSVLEAKYDAYLHWQGIAHAHEVPVPNTTRIADFQIGDRYVEIAGMLGDERYDQAHAVKRAEYEALGLTVEWLTVADVDALFKDCPVELKFKPRACDECGVETNRITMNKCISCYMREYKEKQPEKTCDHCGSTYRSVDESRFCSKDCYWASRTDDDYDWDYFKAHIGTRSITKIAADMGVKRQSLTKAAKRLGLIP